MCIKSAADDEVRKLCDQIEPDGLSRSLGCRLCDVATFTAETLTTLPLTPRKCDCGNYWKQKLSVLLTAAENRTYSIPAEAVSVDLRTEPKKWQYNSR